MVNARTETARGPAADRLRFPGAHPGGLAILVLAIDQGTTGTTAALFDRRGRLVDRAYRKLPQIYPRPGWVEHDPEAIWETVTEAVAEVTGRATDRIAAVGITNQRETTILWDRRSGEPVHNAIVWQCRRTADACDALAEHAELFRERTGLPLDAYFSGTKAAWLLEHAVPSRGRDGAGTDHLAFGTVDAWLVWKLTGGAVHATDPTNASRTLLYDIGRGRWDGELCEILAVPPGLLPEVRPSVGELGAVERAAGLPELEGVPIAGMAGDQQAALFGQTCFEPGEVKSTYGTGCFVVMNTGDERVASSSGLITTLAVGPEGGPCYALEGSVFIAGALLQWLEEELGVLERVADSDAVARSVSDSAGVYIVPAFVGLGAPHWDMRARGTITGITRGVNRAHLVRAALEAIAYQTRDVLVAMERDTGVTPPALAVDGGAAANDFLMQFQADVIGRPVRRAAVAEATSLGAAYLAGLGVGVWGDADELSRLRAVDREFLPDIEAAERERLLEGWERALRQARTR